MRTNYSFHDEIDPEAAAANSATFVESYPCPERAISATQRALFCYGLKVEQQWKLVLFMSFVAFGLCSFGIKDLQLETKVQNLWFSDDGREAQSANKQLMQDSPLLHSVTPVSLIQLLPDAELRRSHLLAHLRLLERLVKMEVHVADFAEMRFSLRHICQKYEVSQLSRLHSRHMHNMMQQLIPCKIITPLDCFWEGSKLLGPKEPVKFDMQMLFSIFPGNSMANKKYKWSNLDPQEVLNSYADLLQPFGRSSSIRELQQQLRDLGITNGYMRRPCLNPRDPACPTQNATDPQLALAKGCHSFSEAISYPLSELLGGVSYSQSGSSQLPTSARALHTTFMLKGPKGLLHIYDRNQPYHGWSTEKVVRVLHAWKTKFVQLVEEENARHAQPIFAASHEESMELSLKEATETQHWTAWSLVLALSSLFAVLILLDLNSPLHSQVTVYLLLLPLLMLSCSASLGLCSWCRISADLLTVQVLPIVQFGIGAYCCLWLASAYNCLYQTAVNDEQRRHTVARLLQQEGSSLASLLAVASTAAVCMLLAPMQAIRQLGLHYTFGCVQLCFLCLASCPAALAADSVRRRSRRADLLCCCIGRVATQASLNKQRCLRVSQRVLRPCSGRLAVRCLSCLLLLLLAAAGGYCAQRLAKGASFDPLQIISSSSMQHLYLESHRSLFSTSWLQLSLQKMDYPHSQQTIRRFHEALISEKFVSSNNTLWLNSFRDWLLRLQRSFDADCSSGRLPKLLNSTQQLAGLSSDTLLAVNLLTPNGEHRDFSQLNWRRLVHEDSGLIDTELFYSCLTAWYSLGGMSYKTANVLLQPIPEKFVQATVQPHEAVTLAVIPASRDIEFAHSQLKLQALNTTQASLQALHQLSSISSSYRSQGVVHRFAGILISAYSPDWLHLPSLATAVALVLVASCVTCFLLFYRLLPAVICTCLCIINLLQLAAALLAAGVELNVVTCAAVGLVFPLIHLINLTLVFHTCLSLNNRRDNNNNDSNSWNNNRSCNNRNNNKTLDDNANFANSISSSNSSSSSRNSYTAIPMQQAMTNAALPSSKNNDDHTAGTEARPSIEFSSTIGDHCNDIASYSTLLSLQALCIPLLAFAVAFVPSDIQLVRSIGITLFSGAACSGITACTLAAAAVQLLPLRSHKLHWCRPKQQQQQYQQQQSQSQLQPISSEASSTATATATATAAAAVAAAAAAAAAATMSWMQPMERQQSLDTIAEESTETSPAATPTTESYATHAQHTVKATLQLSLSGLGSRVTHV